MKERFRTTALNQCMSACLGCAMRYWRISAPHHCNIWLHKNDQPCLFSMLGALRSFYMGPIRVLIMNKLSLTDIKMFVDQFLCFLNVLRFDVVHYIVRIILISFKHSTVMCLHMSTFIRYTYCMYNAVEFA